VHFIDDLFVDADTLPALILPIIGLGVNDLRKPVRAFRLKARCWIRKNTLSTVNEKTIPHARLCTFGDAGKVAVGFLLERYDLGVNCNIHPLTRWRPHSEVNAVNTRLGPCWKPALNSHRHTASYTNTAQQTPQVLVNPLQQ
jgi:hypothetical protein